MDLAVEGRRALRGVLVSSVLLMGGSAWAGTDLSASEAAAQASPFSFVMSAADIPTLGEWAVIVLMVLMGAFAFRRLRRSGALMGAGLGVLVLLVSSGALLALNGLASAVHDPATMLGAPQGHSRSVSVSLVPDAGQTVTGMTVHYRRVGDASWKEAAGAAAPSGGCPACWAATMDTTGWNVGDTVEYYFEAIVGGASTFAYLTTSCAQPANPANGTYAACDPTASGGTCLLTCGAGYTKSGDATCTAGSWDTQTCDPETTAGFVGIHPAGSFWMGSPAGTCPTGYPGSCTSELGRFSNETLHYVTLTKAFEMQAKEVTQGEWKAMFGDWNPSDFPACGDTCPVEQVNWYEAAAYANAKSVAAGKTACYAFAATTCQNGSPADGTDYAFCMDATHGGINSATVTLNGVATPYACTGYRLPTESEWEYGYRGGGVTAFYTSAGNDGAITQTGRSPLDLNLDQIGWYGGNSTSTYDGAFNCAGWFTGSTTCGPQVVGGKSANGLGLYDMAGNVWEWCGDWYGSYPSGSVASPATDPTGGSTGSFRVLRGGCWYFVADSARGAFRYDSPPGNRSYGIGFRLARSL